MQYDDRWIHLVECCCSNTLSVARESLRGSRILRRHARPQSIAEADHSCFNVSLYQASQRTENEHVHVPLWHSQCGSNACCPLSLGNHFCFKRTIFDKKESVSSDEIRVRAENLNEACGHPLPLSTAGWTPPPAPARPGIGIYFLDLDFFFSF